jgi:hypothetical protein
MNEDDLRDCFAMFAMNGILSCENNDTLPYAVLASNAYSVADAMIEARKPKEESGIAAIKPRRKRV